MISPSIPESIKPYSKKGRRLSKFSGINQSIISTRDPSFKRALTPTLDKSEEHPKIKITFIQKPRENSLLTLDSVKSNLQGLFESLPKMPRTSCMKSSKKSFENFIEQKHNHSISKLSNIYFNKSRSKSSHKKSKHSQGKIQNQADLMKIQEYLNDFHSKSKLLLEKLEQNVLGKPSKSPIKKLL